MKPQFWSALSYMLFFAFGVVALRFLFGNSWLRYIATSILMVSMTFAIARLISSKK